MRYPEHTVYINEGNLRYVSERLASFLKERGFKIVECLSIGTKECITLGLFQGASDWTIIKTLPEEFLAEVLPGEKEPLLVALCRELQRGGCMLNVYNEIEAILLETDGAGRKYISGFFDAEETSDKLNDLQRMATENPSVVEFKLLPIEIDILNFDNCGQLAEQLHIELAGRNADLCSNQRFAEAIKGELLKDRQGIKLCFTR